EHDRVELGLVVEDKHARARGPQVLAAVYDLDADAGQGEPDIGTDAARDLDHRRARAVQQPGAGAGERRPREGAVESARSGQVAQSRASASRRALEHRPAAALGL